MDTTQYLPAEEDERQALEEAADSGVIAEAWHLTQRMRKDKLLSLCEWQAIRDALMLMQDRLLGADAWTPDSDPFCPPAASGSERDGEF